MIFRKKHLTAVGLLGLLALMEHGGGSASEPAAPAHFTGRVTSAERLPDKLNVYLSRDFIVGHEEPTVLSIPLDSSGRFHFETPQIERPVTIAFELSLGKDYRILMKNRGMSYWAQPGDDVQMDIGLGSAADRETSVTFSGKGAAKYSIFDSLRAEHEKFFSCQDDRDRCAARAAAAALSVLSQWKDKLGDEVYELYKLEHESLYYFNWYTLMQTADSARRSPQLQIGTVHERIALLSNNYFAYLLEKSRWQLFLASGGTGFEFNALCGKLSNDYDGLIREKLLTYFLLSDSSTRGVIGFKQADYDACLNTAYASMTDSRLKSALKGKVLLGKGTEFYDFSLPDPDGKTVSLRDLRGKVVLVDMWYTGCYGCLNFSTKFNKQVFPIFKDRADFKVVSISADMRKDQWIKSINRGEYTDKHHINLNAPNESNLNKHPLMDYYDINGFPFLVILDKNGRVYSKLEFNTDMQVVTSLIREVLAIEEEQSRSQRERK